MLGDVVGRPGRQAVRRLLPALRQELEPDLVLANGENAAGGNGITEKVAAELFESGIQLLTMGNHVWDQKEALNLLDREPRIIRPANYPAGAPGQGWRVEMVKGTPVTVLNLSGRVFLSDLDCPFRLADRLLEELGERARVVLVDFHAEATSEKQAFAWYLDGRVSAVLGTHTHVQTADERILPRGTAYITDVGMTGPWNSVLGVRTEIVIQKFLSQMPVRFEVAGGRSCLEAVLLEVDGETGRATAIQRIRRFWED